MCSASYAHQCWKDFAEIGHSLGLHPLLGLTSKFHFSQPKLYCAHTESELKYTHPSGKKILIFPCALLGLFMGGCGQNWLLVLLVSSGQQLCHVPVELPIHHVSASGLRHEHRVIKMIRLVCELDVNF